MKEVKCPYCGQIKDLTDYFEFNDREDEDYEVQCSNHDCLKYFNYHFYAIIECAAHTQD